MITFTIKHTERRMKHIHHHIFSMVGHLLSLMLLALLVAGCQQDLYGWDDIDLYMPFCAPFLTGTSESAGDKSVGTYLANVCGSGYPEGSNEANAYQSLRTFPSAIANNKLLREACMRRFYQKDPESYIDIQDGKPNLTKIVIPGGCHSEKFLSPDSCPEEYSALIKQALDKYIKGSS